MESKKWYELEEEERIKQVYSKFTIQQFWHWWSGGENKVMEVRIKDKELIKSVADRLNIPWNYSGVYVNNGELLKRVIAFVRDKATIWFGINPRKKNWTSYGRLDFGGKDVNISEIGFLFIDIDRMTIEKRKATKEELKNADILANKIIEAFDSMKWANSYCKLCSGNGVQLLVKLDFPIRLPKVIFHTKTNEFVLNDEFDTIKNIIKKGIGKQILRESNKLKRELKVIVDKSVFNIGRVGALPFTKNYKYDGFTWRGIVELKNGENEGLSDYVWAVEEELNIYKKRPLFGRPASVISKKDKVIKGKLEEHILAKLLLNKDLEAGGRNNKLWFSFKCLMRDSKIDFKSEEFKKFNRKIERIHKNIFPPNIPEKRFKFNKDTVNSYCIEKLYPLLYPLWPERNKYANRYLNFEWRHMEVYSGSLEFDGADIMEDMEQVKKMLVPECQNNISILARFTRGLIKKYGENIAKYYCEQVFERFFNS